MKVIPSMSMAPPIVLYEAKRANGEGVQTGARQRRNETDSTVPSTSGAAPAASAMRTARLQPFG